MKVLICDPLAESAIARLREAGLEVVVRTGMSPEELAAELAKGYEAIVVRSATKVRKAAIDAARGLKLIVRAGVGLDNIDVEYAREKGIQVRNTPRASTDSVAELALAHMLARGVFRTWIPFSRAYSTSMLSRPTPARTMSLRPTAASMAALRTLVAERTTMAS